jgi:hypothetical protein
MQIQCPKCTQRLQIPGLKPGQMIRQFRVTSEKQPVWICATANVMNFAIFLKIVEKRFGVEIDRP